MLEVDVDRIEPLDRPERLALPERRLLRGDLSLCLIRACLGVLVVLLRNRVCLDQFAIGASKRCGRSNCGPRPRERCLRIGDLRLVRRGVDAVERLALADEIAFREQTRLDQTVDLRAYV